MLGGWRGIDGYGGEEGKDLVGSLDGLKVGFSNDWKAYEGEKKTMCDGQPLTTFLTLTLILTLTLTLTLTLPLSLTLPLPLSLTRWDEHISAREVANGAPIPVPSRLTDALALSPRSPAAGSKPRPTAGDSLSPRGGPFHLKETERLCTTSSLVHPWKDHRDVERIMASPAPHPRATSLHHVVGLTEAERQAAAVRRQAKHAEEIEAKLASRQAS